MIIGLSGYIGSGKDTVATIMQCIQAGNADDVVIEGVLSNYATNQWWLEERSGWEIKKFAGKLKQIASILTGIPVEKFEDQEFKKTFLSREWDTIVPKPGRREDGIFGTGEKMIKQTTVRELLQKLGTEAMRDGLHTNTWVNALFADYKLQVGQYDGIAIRDSYPNWLITDVRFPNEAQAIKDRGGIVIRVNRPSKFTGDLSVALHPSETSLDNWEFDVNLENDSNIWDLIRKVKVLTPLLLTNNVKS